jgi:hypothetical protein
VTQVRPPSYTPITDAAKRRAKDGESVERVVKLSNSTLGRLQTIEKAAGKLTEKERFWNEYQLSEVHRVTQNLERTRDALTKADQARHAAIWERDAALKDLQRSLDDLSLRSQEMSNLQDAIALTLAAVPIAAAFVLAAPEALVVGIAAAGLDKVNDAARAGEDDNPAKTAADAFGDVVGVAGELAGASKIATGTLTGVGVFSTVVDVVQSEGVTAKLDGLTNDSFRALDKQIDSAGPIDKTAARDAASKAEDAQREVNKQEILVRRAEASYLAALAQAEGTTWVRPK